MSIKQRDNTLVLLQDIAKQLADVNQRLIRVETRLCVLVERVGLLSSIESHNKLHNGTEN